jgi:hypothetical protein
MTVLEGGNADDSKKKLDSTWWSTLKMNRSLWPTAQLSNFSIVPLNMRSVFVNIISIGKLIFGPKMMGLDADHE